MEKTIGNKIIEYLKPASAGLYAAEVRIGLGYTSVRLDNGNIGIAWTAKNNPGSCTHENRAGTLAGSTASELLEMLAEDIKPLSRTIGLAAANALVNGLPHPEPSDKDALDIANVQASDHVAMVGFFGPVIPKLKKTGCKLDIIELKSDKPGTLSPENGRKALASCDVAILTATSIITCTIDELLDRLGKPRSVIILGPSSIMCPTVFKGTPVTHIAGSRVIDAAGVEKIVSEGGGTMLLKPYLKFETICL